jgi:hypothetical protein
MHHHIVVPAMSVLCFYNTWLLFRSRKYRKLGTVDPHRGLILTILYVLCFVVFVISITQPL